MKCMCSQGIDLLLLGWLVNNLIFLLCAYLSASSCASELYNMPKVTKTFLLNGNYKNGLIMFSIFGSLSIIWGY